MSNLPGPSPWFFCSKKPQIRRRKGGKQQKINTKMCKHTKCGGNLEETHLRKLKKKNTLKYPWKYPKIHVHPCLFCRNPNLPCHLARSFEEPPDGHQDGLSHLPQLGVETNVSNVQNPYDIPLYSLFFLGILTMASFYLEDHRRACK